MAIQSTIHDVTSQVHTEKALKDSEERYRDLYDNAAVMMHSIDAQGVLTNVNEKWLRTFGYGREEVIGRKATEFLTDASRKYAVETTIPGLFKTGSSENISYQFVTKSRDIVDVRLSATLERDGDGKPVASRAALIDETEKLQAENILRESDQRFSFLINRQDDLMLVFLPDGTRLFVNEAYCKFFGNTANEMLMGIAGDVVSDARQWDLSCAVSALTPEEKTHEYIVKLIRHDGVKREILWTDHGLFDGDGKLAEIHAIGRDITDQFAEHNDALNMVLPVGIFRTDVVGNVTYANAKSCAIGDISLEQAINDGWFGALHADDRERVAVQWSEYLDGNDPVYYSEQRYVRKDGTMVYCVTQARAETDKSGRITGYIGTITDISDKIRAEESVQVVLETLESEVKERTADLEQQVMERNRAVIVREVALARAEQANQAKSMFLAHMSHELRTPLNAITGFSQMIEGEVFGHLGNPKYSEYAGLIYRAGSHLLTIINDILDLSKVEAGKTFVEPVLFDIHKAIEESVHMIRGESTSRFRTKCSTARILLNADERIFRQIILNLLSNADKFTPEDGRIAITSGFQRKGGSFVTVTDTGIGISPEDIPKALEPFGQVTSNTHQPPHGTGLGLPLSKKLSELLGGTFDLESQPGKGTTVTLRFPAELTVSRPLDPCD